MSGGDAPGAAAFDRRRRLWESPPSDRASRHRLRQSQVVAASFDVVGYNR